MAAWSSTTDIQKRVAAGEVADLVILGDSGTEALIKDGKLVASTRAIFAKSGIGIAVRSGARKPDISSADALKKSLLAAKSVGYSEGASGTYLVGMFQKLGIYDQVKSKASVAKANEPVGEKVARGEAEIGFHQLSELIPVKGIHIVGPLPAELQYITVFSGGMHREAKEPDAAKALIKFLTAPAVGKASRSTAWIVTKRNYRAVNFATACGYRCTAATSACYELGVRRTKSAPPLISRIT